MTEALERHDAIWFGWYNRRVEMDWRIDEENEAMPAAAEEPWWTAPIPRE